MLVFLLTAAICFAMGAAESTLLREILLEFLAKCLTTILLPCAIAQGKYNITHVPEKSNWHSARKSANLQIVYFHISTASTLPIVFAASI